MKKENFKSSITANISANEAFKGICEPDKWWSKNIDGNTKKLHAEFTYRPNDTWVKFKITELVPDKKVVWHVTNCFLSFQDDKKEWKDTDVVFEIVGKGNSTQINFTHIGLVPEVACYQGCVKGWNKFFNESLLKLLTTGKGEPA